MATFEQVSALISRLEQASGSDPEIDRDIAITLGISGTAARQYTGLIEAALTLMPKGWGGSMGFGSNPLISVWRAKQPAIECKGATKAIALCICALKALSRESK